MRLLIGNDHPSAIGWQRDVRAWTQRIVWFARPGDVVVLKSPPDKSFVDRVCGLLGFDPEHLDFLIAPQRYRNGNFDNWGLLDHEFQESLISRAGAIGEIIALWPSAEVGWLVESLNISHCLPGSAFLREGGGLLSNSKVLFRSLAASAGAPTPRGGVCHTMEDAFKLSGHLLDAGHGIMVKRCYGGGGAGNAILLPAGASDSLTTSQAGHAYVETIDTTADALHDYWKRLWDWASDQGRFPFVVEVFVHNAETIYVETFCGPDGSESEVFGEIFFEDGKIVGELIPANPVRETTKTALLDGARNLASTYSRLGWRGRLSLDAVIKPNGSVYFTEANARFTGSTHLHDAILPNLVQDGSDFDRVVFQSTTPAEWKLDSIGALLARLDNLGLAFDRKTRSGIVPVTPVVHGSGQAVIATLAESVGAARAINQKANAEMLKPHVEIGHERASSHP